MLAVGFATANAPAAEVHPLERMARATVKIENPGSTATGFFVRAEGANESQNGAMLLITAAHVLNAAKGEEVTLALRERKGEGDFVRVPHAVKIRKGETPLFTKHKSEDIAVLRVALPPQVDALPITLAEIADRAQLAGLSLPPGEFARLAGYPHRNEANAYAFPIVRLGCIASHPLLPVETFTPMLIDMNTHEGDSGGPVYVAPPVANASGATEPRLFVIGLLVGQMNLDEEGKLVFGSFKIRHRLSLGTVLPSPLIHDALRELDSGK